ncbi:ABC transporter substrate-binding protein [Corynebacterium uropygiale]|uniref:ABC transporter substrate-binding protein n=1 Tax=Corynebacterium uropygiale TaxID=1775911 RepID=A0A9X1TZG8_9CORY|nr:ABC transporter substrate-binding protein [Corynebacterium uropygiale]MCF4006876.1 ABC transporter substrate-binding protein [Corynebacterium uropygiale]
MGLKKAVVLLGATGVALSMAACGGGGSGSSDGGIITVNGSEPQNPFIPANTNEVGGGRIVDMLYSGLIYYDAEGKTHNDMAESIDLEGDKTYKVTLKKDLTFSDGSPLTSKNFVDAWNYAVRESLLNSYFFEPIKGYKEGVDSLEGLKVVDDHTFTIELEQPEADFPQRLGYSAYFPMHESAFDDIKAYGQKPIGNGPYTLDSWNHGENATLLPNEHYNGDRIAKNDGIKFVFYAQQDAAYNDLLAGNLDVLDAVPDTAFSTFESDLGDRAVNKPVAVSQSFTIAEGTPHFEGEEGKLRRAALSMAINREEITSQIFGGTRTPATDFTSPVIPGHSDDLKGVDVLKYNPEKAKELWAKAEKIAPFDGQFTIAYNADGGHQAWVDAVTNSIRNTLGIEASGNPYPDFKSLRDDITNRTIKGGFRTGWQADYPSLGNFLGSQWGTGAGSNDSDYSNKDFDAKLNEAAGSATPEEAVPHYNEAQEILLQDLPSIPLWYSNVTGGSSEAVSNVEFDWRSQPLYYAITKS